MATNELANPDRTESEAAQEAAQQAVAQARETATQAVTTIKAMSLEKLVYLGCLTTVVVCTLIFDMASFTVGVDYAVSETTAQAQREMEAKMNSFSYSAFSSTWWGTLMWFSALAGVGLMIWSAVSKSAAGWVPLATIGCAGLTTLLLMLLFLVGFPDLSRFEDASCSATLIGYWVPLAAAGAATFFSAKPIFFR